jgi:tetratricopeptide (TPR) repeat protein
MFQYLMLIASLSIGGKNSEFRPIFFQISAPRSTPNISTKIVDANTAIKVGRIAKNITVYIEQAGSQQSGSGIILQKQGEIYTILTAGHVLKDGGIFRITTVDGRIHSVLPNSLVITNNFDLAIIKFRSNQNYPVVEIGSSNTLEFGSELYVAGFPAPTTTIEKGILTITKGTVTANASKANKRGYSLIYSNATLPGMSGGPVLDASGKLVAIHGQGDRSNNGEKTGFNLGIVIERLGLVAQAMGIKLTQPIALLPLPTAFRAENYFLTAAEKEQAGDYLGAIADYSAAIKLRPNFATAYNNRGILKKKQQGDIRGALADYDSAIRANSQLPEPYFNRAIIKKSAFQDFNGALADYNQAIKINPQYVSAYFNRAILKYRIFDDIPGAIDDLSKAIQADPKFVDAYLNRATIKYEKINDVRSALTDLNMAIKLAPGNGYAYYNRGYLKGRSTTDFAGALADFDRAIQIMPEFANAYYNRGLLKKNKLKDRSGAISDLRRAAQIYQEAGFSEDEKDALRELQELEMNQ